MEKDEEAQLHKRTCKSNHKFSKAMYRVAFHLFNVMAKNFTAQINDSIRNRKKRSEREMPASKDNQKIRKLSSQ